MTRKEAIACVDIFVEGKLPRGPFGWIETHFKRFLKDACKEYEEEIAEMEPSDMEDLFSLFLGLAKAEANKLQAEHDKGIITEEERMIPDNLIVGVVLF